jgi:assimilatory nitrate reductase catalytic subunit
MFDAIAAGKIKAVWIMATNPVVSMPDADKVRDALRRCPLVVVSDCIRNTDTVDLAHVRLPATGWSEKNGTVTNLERRISRQRPLFAASGEAKPDWWIINQVAKRMGFSEAFDYRASAEIFREHAALSAFENGGEFPIRAFNLSAFANIDQSQFDTLQPVQWPVTVQQHGTARLCGDGNFYTANGKARFVPTAPRSPFNNTDGEYPFTLNTGRLRDQWHTMTRTGLVAKLNAHRPEPFVEIHPDDAHGLRLIPGCLARIESRWGSMLARVEISSGQQVGSLFVPMHWTAQYSSHGRMGAVVNPVVDPISGQPESKQTPVNISLWPTQWQVLILSRQTLSLPACEYGVNNKGIHFWSYQLAGQNPISDAQSWSRKFLAKADTDTLDSVEYCDLHHGDYRAARFENGRLQSCVFFTATGQLPEPGWLSTLFAKTELTRKERLCLLGGIPPQGEADVGHTICSCFNVGEKTILKAIKTHNLSSVAAIGQCVNAGTGCGSCLPELKALLLSSKIDESH